jgi:hypothetical protein
MKMLLVSERVSIGGCFQRRLAIPGGAALPYDGGKKPTRCNGWA